MCILELSEVLMYDKDFSNNKEMFDFSYYSTKSKYYNSNKLVVGKMKDETAGVAIEEFVKRQRL